MSTSPEMEMKRSRCATAPDEKDIFSKWAQGAVDQSTGSFSKQKSRYWMLLLMSQCFPSGHKEELTNRQLF